MTLDPRTGFLFLVLFFTLSQRASPSGFKSPEQLAELDSVIQSLAFNSLELHHPCRTGKIYNVSLPPAISTCVTAQITRLRTGSLRRRGFIFNEFSIPRNAQVLRRSEGETPERVAFIYRKFHNCFPIAEKNTTSGGTVIGIKAYDASDDAAEEIRLVMKGEPASFTLPRTGEKKGNDHMSCVAVDSTTAARATISSRWSEEQGSRICSTLELGDFSLVAALGTTADDDSSSSSNLVNDAALVAAAGLVAAAVGTGVAVILRRRRREQRERMLLVSESGESLGNFIVGGSRACTASATRTRPVSLEQGYTP